MTPDPAARLRELIQKWRDAAVWEHDDMGNIQSALTFDQCADELEAALRPLPAAGQCCTNCGHVEPHNAPSGDVADGCSHPMCRCGFDSRGDTSTALPAPREAQP